MVEPGREEIYPILIKHMSGKTNVTVYLDKACSHNFPRLVRHILECPGVKYDRQSALFQGVYNGHIEVVKVLIESGIIPLERYLFRDAVENGDIPMIEYLSNFGFYPDSKDLRIACLYNQFEMFKFLIQKGVRDELLKIAIADGKLEIVKYILEMGLESIDDLKIECCSDIETVQYLFDTGAKFTPHIFEHPCSEGDTSMINYLLDLGFKPNFESILTSVENGQIEVVRILWDTISWFPNQIFIRSIELDHLEIVRLFLENGFNPNVESGKPLKLARQKDFSEIESLLLKFGAKDRTNLWKS